MDDLPLQVGLVDGVGVHDADVAHAGGRQIHEAGGAQATGSDDQNGGILERLLAGHGDVRKYQVTRVAGNFGVGQLGVVLRFTAPPAAAAAAAACD